MSWATDTYRGGWYGGPWYASWRDRLPRLPHVISICTAPPTEEPLTLDEAKLAANFTWTSPDERDAQLLRFVKAARAKVELDTALALLTQTREVYLDVVSSSIIILPEHCLPLQQVVSIVTIGRDGTATTMNPASYVVDAVGGRIALAESAQWPSDLRSFQPWTITVIAGWATAADLADQAPVLRHMVELLTAHYATLGRDLATIERGTLDQIPQGYLDLLAPYAPVTVI